MQSKAFKKKSGEENTSGCPCSLKFSSHLQIRFSCVLFSKSGSHISLAIPSQALVPQHHIRPTPPPCSTCHLLPHCWMPTGKAVSVNGCAFAIYHILCSRTLLAARRTEWKISLCWSVSAEIHPNNSVWRRLSIRKFTVTKSGQIVSM